MTSKLMFSRKEIEKRVDFLIAELQEEWGFTDRTTATWLINQKRDRRLKKKLVAFGQYAALLDIQANFRRIVKGLE